MILNNSKTSQKTQIKLKQKNIIELRSTISGNRKAKKTHMRDSPNWIEPIDTKIDLFQRLNQCQLRLSLSLSLPSKSDNFLSYLSNKGLKSKKIEVLYHNRIFEILKDQKVIIEKVKRIKIYFLPYFLNCRPFSCCFTLWSLLFQSCYSLTIIDKLIMNLVKRIQLKRKKVWELNYIYIYKYHYKLLQRVLVLSIW